jgi:predicted YcjX-like family ATPase
LRVTDLADSVLRVLEDAQAGAEELLFEPTVRLGVTGLSRAGKTVFITSLVANLMNRGRMLRLSAAAEGRIEAVELRPQPDRQTPRFDYESHLGSLLGPTPRWPASTRQVSQLRLSLRVRPTGLLAGLRGPRIVHLDIVDYPGEWLLDLPLLSQSYAEWSAAALEAAGKPARAPYAASWLAALGAADPDAEFDETTARTLAEAYRAYLAACRAAGLSALSPGRFLMPGDLAGSPALTFAPLPPGQRGARRSLATEMARRYDAYVEAVVKPFFRNHFARLDRQVVLVDVLSAIDSGPQAVSDLREEMTSLLSAFRHGANDWLSSIRAAAGDAAPERRARRLPRGRRAGAGPRQPPRHHRADRDARRPPARLRAGAAGGAGQAHRPPSRRPAERSQGVSRGRPPGRRGLARRRLRGDELRAPGHQSRAGRRAPPYPP